MAGAWRSRAKATENPTLTFAPREERLIEAAEIDRKTIAAEFLRLRHREQFDEKARHLDHVVMRPPGVPIAGADGEAEPAIKLGPRLEIAHGVDNVIKAAGHGPSSL